MGDAAEWTLAIVGIVVLSAMFIIPLALDILGHKEDDE